MVGRARMAQHHAVEAVMVLEAVQHVESQPLLIEAQQGVEVVARPGDTQDRDHERTLSLCFAVGQMRYTCPHDGVDMAAMTFGKMAWLLVLGLCALDVPA